MRLHFFPTRISRIAARAAIGLAVLAAGLACAGDPSRVPLRPDPSRLAAAPAELKARLREDPIVYFRFVNAEWAGRTCAAFQDELPSLPTVMLHGDLHVEQYALTATARGLDDFDDAARGPSVIDTVRFLGSVDLVARRRGWTSERQRLFDSFFEGYTRALSNPAYLPSEPGVVKRLRARSSRTREEFLAWCESLMQPLPPELVASVPRSLRELDRTERAHRPELSKDYFRLKKAGALHMGVGSALARKYLARVEGPTASPADDILIEAKELGRLEAVPCLSTSMSGAARVVNASTQIGRIQHEIIWVVPRVADQGSELRDWWVRSWNESYREVAVADLASADDLAELAHDAGAQLGATNLLRGSTAAETQLRAEELAAVRRLAARIHATACRLTDDLLDGWEELRQSPAE